MAHVVFFYAMLLVACGYALRAGGGPERAAAGILLGGTLATWAVAIAGRGWFDGQFRQIEWGIFLVDLAMLVALCGLAAVADRFWPLWLTAFHGFGVVGHVARIVAPAMLPDVYKAAHAFSAYPIMTLLILATRWHVLRRRAHGGDRSWSIFWRWPTGRRRETGLTG